MNSKCEYHHTSKQLYVGILRTTSQKLQASLETKLRINLTTLSSCHLCCIEQAQWLGAQKRILGRLSRPSMISSLPSLPSRPTLCSIAVCLHHRFSFDQGHLPSCGQVSQIDHSLKFIRMQYKLHIAFLT